MSNQILANLAIENMVRSYRTIDENSLPYISSALFSYVDQSESYEERIDRAKCVVRWISLSEKFVNGNKSWILTTLREAFKQNNIFNDELHNLLERARVGRIDEE